MSYDPALLTHRAWIGMLQPVGVVVSPPALLAAQAVVDENLKGLRETFDDLLLPPRDEDGARAVSDALPLHIKDFARFAETFLGWSRETDLVPLAELPDALRVPLPEYETELAPTWAVAQSPDAVDPAHGEAGRWLALVQVLPRGWDLDNAHGSPHDGRAWHASPQSRFERLLRETRVPLGMIFNETSLRVVYQPVGEASGHVTFPFALLAQTQGSLCLGALKLLLEADRLFTGTTSQRLPAILKASRKFQNEVSGRLAEQVLDALWELLQGFRSAHAASGETLLRTLIARDRQKIYGGLLTVLLRLVFVLKAEDQGLLPSDPLYVENYGLRGLFESLREDLGRHPDAMDLRAHAWGRLIALFRLIHDGGAHGSVRLPPRYGELFDPDAYPFLEGREEGSLRQAGEVLRYPAVSDGVVYRVLAKLLVLDGEALSYRTLDVEQLGGVYEALMGFTVERVTGSAVALSPDDVVIDLDALLAVKRDRAKHLGTAYGVKAEGELAKKLDAATTVDGLITALGRRVSKRTPTKLPQGALVLQPTEERRRSGSHYTPRALTEPIVRTTLDPVLTRLGERPTPAQILSLRVCDPAMGSGAFLVAVCRYLGDALVRAWGHHGRPAGDDAIPPDEDEILHARRLVAQRCLYGVDRNAFAVSLAKLSLWLVTMAKDHPFTFLDPLLRHGDSLVGLTRDQLRAFHWSVDVREVQLDLLLDRAMKQAVALREKIQEKASSDDTAAKTDLHREAEETLGDARLLGDLVVEAFFRADKDKAREARRKAHHAAVLAWQDGRLPRTELTGLAEGLREGDSNHRPVIPFHWPLAFPEVFARDNPGFDAMVGNPPFAGRNTIIDGNGANYTEWLVTTSNESNGKADLAAFFFRRAFDVLRDAGTFGLIATNTISQGDTRHAGLRWIGNNGGHIFSATKRYAWPGLAAVVVSVVHVQKRHRPPTATLNNIKVDSISAYLSSGSVHDDPAPLEANAGRNFQGANIDGQGFVFGNDDPDLTPTSEFDRIVSINPRSRDVVFPYLGGEQHNQSPDQKPSRMVIRFGTRDLDECRAHFPELLAIVESKVKPFREQRTDNDQSRHLKAHWWRWHTERPSYWAAAEGKVRSLANSQVSSHLAFSWQPTNQVYGVTLNLFTDDRDGFFAVMQSRVHELWARFFASTLEDRLRYTPSDCFETFPFPAGWETNAALEDLGRRYHARRAEIMVARNEGLTKTYNRFHDPDETDDDITGLRALHDAMDRAVLDAYGWTEIRPAPAFIAEHAAEEEDDGAEGRRKKKRAVRYRWPDADRDAVLAKLLALNAARAKEERKARELAAQLEKVAKKTKGKKG